MRCVRIQSLSLSLSFLYMDTKMSIQNANMLLAYESLSFHMCQLQRDSICPSNFSTGLGLGFLGRSPWKLLQKSQQNLCESTGNGKMKWWRVWPSLNLHEFKKAPVCVMCRSLRAWVVSLEAAAFSDLFRWGYKRTEESTGQNHTQDMFDWLVNEAQRWIASDGMWTAEWVAGHVELVSQILFWNKGKVRTML